ncbi:unnamed protein product [Prunus armeniaca]|uniref:Uncharacterized protein n=1 Tax=Prunus armeniaca TaxID=36596 RepID=A0A6J5W1W9_PRUAR|nr:unnamed protein product [Prunus armeniaca]
MDAIKISAVELGAQTWGLGGGKRGAAAAIVAWVSEGDSSKMIYMGNGGREVGKRKSRLIELNMPGDKKFVRGKKP